MQIQAHDDWTEIPSDSDWKVVEHSSPSISGESQRHQISLASEHEASRLGHAAHLQAQPAPSTDASKGLGHVVTLPSETPLSLDGKTSEEIANYYKTQATLSKGGVVSTYWKEAYKAQLLAGLFDSVTKEDYSRIAQTWAKAADCTVASVVARKAGAFARSVSLSEAANDSVQAAKALVKGDVKLADKFIALAHQSVIDSEEAISVDWENATASSDISDWENIGTSPIVLQ